MQGERKLPEMHTGKQSIEWGSKKRDNLSESALERKGERSAIDKRDPFCFGGGAGESATHMRGPSRKTRRRRKDDAAPEARI